MPIQSSNKISLPALDRGLHILDQLIRSDAPLRYNELKASFPGIQDSTLSRILKALENYGYIERDADLGYNISCQVRAWSPYLSNQTPDFATLSREAVEQLVEHGRESAAVVQLDQEILTTIASRSVHNGIQVLQVGDLLHYEADHAAAVAILSALPASKRQQCLHSTTSRFPADYDFERILREMRQENELLIDRSQERPGVCRIAKSFHNGEQLCAIFYCLTVEACQTKFESLAPRLIHSAQRLEAQGQAPNPISNHSSQSHR
ncbi:helix-turn-helix domain-containing protein [Coraliomargarita sp. SDUM461004]|uniref:Helix-turn-helix domain-containing protein n=1 Tax=Thalassobacterium sedimentorum TaxID=3041258 RepID=A0ABU1AKI7_9BACT|nr:helix-turn-helix domain-containing protein [Coraliomargarita sp. SDUM461004]MDQ8195330.1 helix-turn-helix domain-containing protein [Coraliomargarita sp. SDUM461004]